MKLVNPYILPELEFVGGSTQDIRVRCFFHKDKTPYDLSSCVVNFALINYVNKNGEPLVSKKMDINASKDDAGGVKYIASVTLNPADTVDLVGKFIYQISIRDASGEVEIPKQGIAHIINNINKNFTENKKEEQA